MQQNNAVTFSDIKRIADEFLKSKDAVDIQADLGERYSVGWYVHIYVLAQGVDTVYMFDKEGEEKQYHGTLTSFFTNVDATQKFERFVIAALNFLIWIRTQHRDKLKEISDKRPLLKQALENVQFINRILKNESIENNDKLHIMLSTYVIVQENLRNVVEERMLIDIYNVIPLEKRHKEKEWISLGDFRKIVEEFEKQSSNSCLSALLDETVRNRVLHADFKIEEEQITLYKNSKELRTYTPPQTNELLQQVAVTLQFFILFYLRLFRSGQELFSKNS